MSAGWSYDEALRLARAMALHRRHPLPRPAAPSDGFEVPFDLSRLA